MLRAVADSIQVSKLHWRYIDSNRKPLTFEEAFYIGTMGGGEFFGKTGSFLEGYEFDAIIPVSYTHLDVYKRQVDTQTLPPSRPTILSTRSLIS